MTAASPLLGGFDNRWNCGNDPVSKLSVMDNIKSLPFPNQPFSVDELVKFADSNNVFSAVLIKSETVRYFISLLKFGPEDAYVYCSSGMLGDEPDESNNLDEYSWVLVDHALSCGSGAQDKMSNGIHRNGNSTKSFSANMIPWQVSSDLKDQFCYDRTVKGVTVAVLFDLLVNKAFCHAEHCLSTPMANITIDIPLDSVQFPFFRDQLGFSVLSRKRFIQIELRISDVLAKLETTSTECNDFQVCAYEDTSFSGVVTFDCQVFGFRRVQFLRSLFADQRYRVIVARSGYQYFGLAVFDISGRVLCLYADNEHITNKLFVLICNEVALSGQATLTLFVDEERKLFPEIQAQQKVVLRRLHTKCIVEGINWHKVFVANCGLHVV